MALNGETALVVLVVFASLFAKVFYVLLFLRVILSYFVRSGNAFFSWLVGITEPLLGPIRRFLPKTPGIDLAPLVAFVLLQLLEMALSSLVVVQ